MDFIPYDNTLFQNGWLLEQDGASLRTSNGKKASMDEIQV